MDTHKYLVEAQRNKKDEFYTRYQDIDAECRHYTEYFKDKIIYCNCDNPFVSNFVRYFIQNFNAFGLKKLISTCYNQNSTNYGHLNLFDSMFSSDDNDEKAYHFEVSSVPDSWDEKIESLLDIDGNSLSELQSNGDFRSKECIDLLDESDIIVTNPPFSMFIEYIYILLEHEKHFLILGNIAEVGTKPIFKLFKDNIVHLGMSITGGGRPFYIPDDYPLDAWDSGIDKDGRKFIRVKGVRWFTNLGESAVKPWKLEKSYTGNEDYYPKYENYNAINIDDVYDIPKDYYGEMGVPISFMDKYCKDQFDIIRFRTGNDNKDLNVNGQEKYCRMVIKRNDVGCNYEW